ncbi:MAG: N-acetyltransferase, partial [Bacteroidetes bacterium]
GKRRNAIYICGKNYDEIFMDILAKEFKSVYIKKIMADIKDKYVQKN